VSRIATVVSEMGGVGGVIVVVYDTFELPCGSVPA